MNFLFSLHGEFIIIFICTPKISAKSHALFSCQILDIHNIDQLSTLLNTLKVKFDIFGITESGLTADKQGINNIDLEGYVIESTPTAASCGGALLYINKNVNFKLRNDLKIYKFK